MLGTNANISLDGYIRVSQTRGREGDSFISPKVQRDCIQKWADARSVSIVAWHEDLDQSGGKLHRPGLDAMLGRIRSGQTGGLAVAHLDRLSRAGVADALRLVESVHEAGAKIAVVDLGDRSHYARGRVLDDPVSCAWPNATPSIPRALAGGSGSRHWSWNSLSSAVRLHQARQSQADRAQRGDRPIGQARVRDASGRRGLAKDRDLLERTSSPEQSTGMDALDCQSPDPQSRLSRPSDLR